RSKNISISETRRFLPHEVREPLRGIRFAVNFEIFLSDHIGQDYRLNALEVSGYGEARCEFAAAVRVVVILIPITESFLAIQERDPDGIGLLPRTEKARHLEHKSSGRAAIFLAHE